VLKIVVIVMGVLIIGGMGVIGVTMVRRITSASTDTVETTATTEMTVAGFGQVELAVPAGARLVEMDVDGDRLVLHLETADGPRILVIDLTTGKTVGAIDLAPAP
jgi:hypothetical protein